jgi:hypothetical protein
MSAQCPPPLLPLLLLSSDRLCVADSVTLLFSSLGGQWLHHVNELSTTWLSLS